MSSVVNGISPAKPADSLYPARGHEATDSLRPRRNGDVVSRVVDALVDGGVLPQVSNGYPVINFRQPLQLKKELGTSDERLSEDGLVTAVKQAVASSVRTGHSMFVNQLYGGLDPYGLVGALVSEALNTSQYTYEVAPVFTMCEEEVLNRYMSLIGFDNGEGLFAPGGSISNMYAICLARYRRFPDIKKKGLWSCPRTVVFASQDSHYSVLKAANWLGLGTDNVILIETDERGRMKPASLAKAVASAQESGAVPLAVVATAGTTVLGAFDPLDPIADICDASDIWLHVDACLGGSLIFSKEHSSRLAGIERASSVAWNAHKMLGAPLQCSMFVTKEKGLLHKCNGAKASYLFQQDKMYDPRYDTGDRSIQCGRKIDGYKLWTMWRTRGDTGFAKLVDQAISNTRYFEKQIRGRPGFRLVLPESESCNVCFWYIPERLRGKPEDEEWWQAVGKVAPQIKSRLVSEGSLMISYQPLASKALVNFFRLAVTCQPVRSQEVMDSIISLIEKHGASL